MMTNLDILRFDVALDTIFDTKFLYANYDKAESFCFSKSKAILNISKECKKNHVEYRLINKVLTCTTPNCKWYTYIDIRHCGESINYTNVGVFDWRGKKYYIIHIVKFANGKDQALIFTEHYIERFYERHMKTQYTGNMEGNNSFASIMHILINVCIEPNNISYHKHGDNMMMFIYDKVGFGLGNEIEHNKYYLVKTFIEDSQAFDEQMEIVNARRAQLKEIAA